MKVMVTGAGGFVGEYLVNLLNQRQHDVVAVGMNNGIFLQKMNIRTYVVNILDFNVLREIMHIERPDAVIHLAAVSNVPIAWKNPGLTVDVNIHGAVNVLQALHEVNANAKFINIGSSDEYGLAAKSGTALTEEMACQPQNPYSISKYCSEQMLIQFGKKYSMNIVSTRSFNHYGPGQAKGFVISDFASQIVDIEMGLAKPEIAVGDISAARDFTYVTDVVRAYVSLLEKKVDSGVYNVCSGKTMVIENVLKDMLSLAECNIKISQIKEKFRPAEVKYFAGNGNKLRNAINWEPVYDYKQGLRDVLDYWRNKHK